MYTAVDNNNNKIIKYLINNNANVNIEDNYDYSPIHVAVNNGN